MCEVIQSLRAVVNKWLDSQVDLNHECLKFYYAQSSCEYEDNHNKISVIWLATNWNIWLMCNVIMFQGSFFNFEDCLLFIKFQTLRWMGLGVNPLFFVAFMISIYYFRITLGRKGSLCCIVMS